VAFMAQEYLRMGAQVEFPTLEAPGSRSSPQLRLGEIYHMLAGIDANGSLTLGDEITRSMSGLAPGSVVFALIACVDETILQAARSLRASNARIVALLYDASAYYRRGLMPGSMRSATDATFVSMLEQAGIESRIMPVQVNP